jgi:biotin transporter BioY
MLIATLLTIVLISQPVSANPTAGPELCIVPIYGMVFVYFLVCAIEFGIAYLILGRRMKKPVDLLWIVMLVNLVTFPATQMLSFMVWLNSDGNRWAVYLTESFPVLAELFLINALLGRAYAKHSTRTKISVTRIGIAVLTMNMATFILGIIILEYFQMFD